jgi:hypothetical protein
MPGNPNVITSLRDANHVTTATKRLNVSTLCELASITLAVATRLGTNYLLEIFVSGVCTYIHTSHHYGYLGLLVETHHMKQAGDEPGKTSLGATSTLLSYLPHQLHLIARVQNFIRPNKVLLN